MFGACLFVSGTLAPRALLLRPGFLLLQHEKNDPIEIRRAESWWGVLVKEHKRDDSRRHPDVTAIEHCIPQSLKGYSALRQLLVSEIQTSSASTEALSPLLSTAMCASTL